MKAVVRGTVCAIALVAALAGCGNDAGGTPTPGSAGAKGKTSGPLSVEQIRSALPTDTSLGNNLAGDEAVATGGEEARTYCTETTAATCDGLVAAGMKELTRRGPDETKVEFSLFSFDSPKSATAAMKSLSAKRRTDIEPTPQPVKVEAGADETDAFGNNRVTATTMRVGSVLVYIWAVETNLDQVNVAAKHQVDRLKSAA
ncbi:hypothetical protein [Streptomyces sp. NPDC096339]|uniref:hypothetical protein n=1 Tax=Streptomyces sp. NPDC096339 TaxID=3366086 RepID=UPI0038083233